MLKPQAVDLSVRGPREEKAGGNPHLSRIKRDMGTMFMAGLKALPFEERLSKAA